MTKHSSLCLALILEREAQGLPMNLTESEYLRLKEANYDTREFLKNLQKRGTGMNKVKRTERGWGGHFICADRCLFRRNTLLEYEDIKIVVSTVGLMQDIHHEDKTERHFEQVGLDRYFETMVFHADPKDTRYHDADVSREISFNSNWAIDKIDADDEANDMHDAVVQEISDELACGTTFERREQ